MSTRLQPLEVYGVLFITEWTSWLFLPIFCVLQQPFHSLLEPTSLFVPVDLLSSHQSPVDCPSFCSEHEEQTTQGLYYESFRRSPSTPGFLFWLPQTGLLVGSEIRVHKNVLVFLLERADWRMLSWVYRVFPGQGTVGSTSRVGPHTLVSDIIRRSPSKGLWSSSNKIIHLNVRGETYRRKGTLRPV